MKKFPKALKTGRYKVCLTGRIVKCAYCGKDIYKAAWQLKQKKHYCSEFCRRKDKVYICSWAKRGRIVKCEYCGKLFYGSPKRLKYKHHYCSQVCKAKDVATWLPSGEAAHSWRGGKSFELYPKEFNRRLKRKIRNKYAHICQRCFKAGDHVHHIDYNKQNCKECNLILLCKSCNSVVNNNRAAWTAYFKLMT